MNRDRRQTVLSLASDRTLPPHFVSTRYQGSKSRLLPFLHGIFSGLEFESALDLFSGSAAVSYLLKWMGKTVHANDLLRANAATARALVQNQSTKLPLDRALQLFERKPKIKYQHVIEKTFDGVFFTQEENVLIDTAAQNIDRMKDELEQSLALYALFQSCLKKRPFNLFHRKNLNLRTRNVSRSFGNKATWEAPLEKHFEDALVEADEAVFSGPEAKVTNLDARMVEVRADLVYVDPPYATSSGRAHDYLDFYHFLEGLTEYDRWPKRIDKTKAHLPYLQEAAGLQTAKAIKEALAEIFDRHRQSILVVSYREDGLPSPAELSRMLEDLGKKVFIHRADHHYALSKRRVRELVFVAQ